MFILKNVYLERILHLPKAEELFTPMEQKPVPQLLIPSLKRILLGEVVLVLLVTVRQLNLLKLL